MEPTMTYQIPDVKSISSALEGIFAELPFQHFGTLECAMFQIVSAASFKKGSFR
jgi:hypothetical protein